MIPDWQLPPGVDRGLWDYLHSRDMVAGYDRQMAESPLAAADVRFCQEWFPTPGRLVDLGCGTARLGAHFAAKGYEYVGVDLSDEMLEQARRNVPGGSFVKANLVDLAELPDNSFDCAACLFSTLGMVRGEENRLAALRSAFRVLKPGGRFVLHVHNRWFRRLGWRRVVSGDVTMPQAYGGAPLTLYHFGYREALHLIWEAGFATLFARPVGTTADGRLPREKWLPAVRAYGYLFAAERPVSP